MMEEAQVVLRTKLIDPQGVAAEYGIPVMTQRDLRRRGEFVSALKIGRRLYYRRERWRRGSTSDPWMVAAPHDRKDKEPPRAMGRLPKAATNRNTRRRNRGAPVLASRRIGRICR